MALLIWSRLSIKTTTVLWRKVLHTFSSTMSAGKKGKTEVGVEIGK